MASSSSSEEDSKSISSDSSSGGGGGSSSSGIVVDPSAATGTQASSSSVAAPSVVKDAVASASGRGDPGGASKADTNPNLTSESATGSSPSKVSASVSAVIGAVVNWATGGPVQTATTTAPTVPAAEAKASVESGGMTTTPTTKAATMAASDNGASTNTTTTKEASSASQQPSLPLLHSKSAEAQALLAKDWSELSSAERQTILTEVNGSVPTSTSPVTDSKTGATPFIEDPVMVERCLKQMEQEIQHVRRSRSSYDRAMFLAPHRIKDRKFRLMFLRAEHFDSYRATQRFMKHFEFKNSLFGYEKLVEGIRLDDLNEDDTESYLSGTFQVLSRAEAGGKGSSHNKRNKTKGAIAADAGSRGRSVAGFAGSKKTDQYGRPVTWFAPHLGQFKSYRSMLRVLWYCYMSLLENEDAQRTGIVHIQYHVASCTSATSSPAPQQKGSKEDDEDASAMDVDDGSQSSNHRFSSLSSSSLFKDICTHGPAFLDALPIRFVAIHYGYDVDTMQPDMDVYSVIGRDLRCRIREHYGSAKECLSELTDYGISPDMIPVDQSGTLLFEEFMKYVDERESIETISKEKADKEHDGGGSNGDKILVPTRNDVLFGRGRPFQDHIGNKYLARLVDEHKTVYTSSENHDKTTISWLLVDKVKENNGRFLKRVEDGKTGDTWWEEVSHDIARAKVTKSFRADMSKKPPKGKEH